MSEARLMGSFLALLVIVFMVALLVTVYTQTQPTITVMP